MGKGELPKVGAKYEKGKLSRTVTGLDFHDWLNCWLVSYVDQRGKSGNCSEYNFRRWCNAK